MNTCTKSVINPIIWSDVLKIGVPSLDHEHQTIIDTANLFISHIGSPIQYTVMDRVLRDLFAYFENHFSHEEDLMETYHYPEALHHKNEHKNFTSKMRVIDKELDAGTAMADALALYIMGWFTTHTMWHDKPLGDYLSRHLSQELTPLEFEPKRSV